MAIIALTPITYTSIFYVSTSGSDSSGLGTLGSPWKTLNKACASVSQIGSLIHVTAGTYWETLPCNLSVGVSIEGDGAVSQIMSSKKSTYILDGAITLASSTEGTDGRQSISSLKLNGNGLAGDNAIVVHGRSNVKLHDLTIIDFYANAVQFDGRVGPWGTVPATYATGNELYNSSITNCSTRNASNRSLAIGMIAISGQQDLLIHDNVLTQVSRPVGENGNILEAIQGNNKGLKYFNNKSYKPDTEGTGGWNFHIEHWNSTGGMEVYGNEFWGGVAIDMFSSVKGAYGYSWWIHDNLMALRSQIPTYQATGMIGVDIEGTTEDAIVSGNHFRNLATGVIFTLQFQTVHQKNIQVHHNIFENIGYADGSFSFVISSDVTGASMFLEDVSIDSNTIVTTSGAGKPNGALLLNAIGTAQRIYLRNNIIESAGAYGYIVFWNNPGTIDSIYSQNNLLYNNVNANNPFYFGGKAVSNFLNQNNLVSDPLFLNSSDFSLQASSPAIDHGINIGQPYNGLAPDSGAIEYGTVNSFK